MSSDSPNALLARAMAADQRFGSLAEIGRIMGLTRERVRQLAPGHRFFQGGGRPRLACWEKPDSADLERYKLLRRYLGARTAREVFGFLSSTRTKERSGCARPAEEVELAAATILDGGSYSDAAAAIGVNWSTIARWAKAGKVPRNPRGRNTRRAR